MQITFLGTGTSQGIPVITCQCEVCNSLDYRNNRLRVSVHIAVDGLSLIIDIGPDFRQQMLREPFIEHLDAVLITHEHKDHTAGLDDIRAFNFKQNTAMPVYAESRVHDQLKREYSYVFEENKYPGIPQIELIGIENKPFSIKNTTITPIRAMHHQLPVLGFRIKDFAYITDANFIDESEWHKLAGVKILVLNALQKTEHISHFTLEQSISFIQKIKPARAYLTHMSHKMGLHAEVSKELPENIQLAYDGLILEL